ncbi:MAG: hypothetical protein JWO32_1578 [Bacteroidetes bacterium]|nr:hypothetical protein [Bacteroidota bacterium]
MSKDFENNNLNDNTENAGVPEGYFEKSANSIKAKIEWLEEHKKFSHLNKLKKQSGFTVPKHYFENSEDKLELIGCPELLRISRDTDYRVPKNYFEELEVSELRKVFNENENEPEAFGNLTRISKQNSFSVSKNYFKDSEAKLTDILHKKPKVIQLFGVKTWYSAAAAVFALTLGLWLYSSFFKPVVVKDCGTLACIDKNDLVKTKNLENLDDDQLYEIVNTKKLEEKLENSQEKDKSKTDTSLKNLSTEELLDEI